MNNNYDEWVNKWFTILLWSTIALVIIIYLKKNYL